MKLVRVSVMALCAMSLFASCNNKKATESAESMMVEVVQPRVKLASVSVQDVDQLQVYAATVVSDVKNNIAPAAPSRIEKIFVEVGDKIAKGQRDQLLPDADVTAILQKMIKEMTEDDKDLALFGAIRISLADGKIAIKEIQRVHTFCKLFGWGPQYATIRFVQQLKKDPSLQVEGVDF